MLSIAFGTAAAVSFSFHSNIAQSLSRLDKVVYFLFAAIPFSALFHIILRSVLHVPGRRTLLVIVVLSLLLGLGMTVFVYPEIKPVKQHAITISLPGSVAQEAGDSLTITAAKIHDHGVQGLALSQFHGAGKFDAKKDEIVLSPDSSVSIAAQYSGNLHVYLTPSRCPMPLVLTVDGRSYEADACDADTSVGLTFGEADSGSLTPRWAALLKLLKGLDFILFTLLSAGVLLALRWCYISIRAGSVPAGRGGIKRELRFLLASVIILAIVTMVVLLTNLLSVVLLVPLLVFLGLDYLHIYRKSSKTNYFLLYLAILLFFITGTVLNVIGHSVYRQYLKPFPQPVHDRTNSINALVISVFNGFDNSLLYGYEDVLTGRVLIISNETIHLMDPDVDLLTSRLNLERLSSEDFEPKISSGQFAFLLTQKHGTWNDGRGYQYYFTDVTAFQPGEAVIVRQFENWIILVPVSVNQRLEGGL